MNSRKSCPLPLAWRRWLGEAVLLCLLAAVVGLSLNYRAVWQAFSGTAGLQTVAQQRASAAVDMADPQRAGALPGPVFLEELDGLLSASALLVDARSSAAYQRAHLPGALSLPLEEWPQPLASFRQQVSTEQTLILYCSGFGCPDSFDLGVLLLAEGYQDVLVYEGGLPEWRDAGRPLEGAQP